MDIWNDDVADEVVVPFADVLDMDIDSTNPNESTTAMVSSTASRENNSAVGQRFSNNYPDEVLAMAQLARMSYTHSDASLHDDMRRAIDDPQYPTHIKVGVGNGLTVDGQVPLLSNDTGIIPYQIERDAPEGLMCYRPMSRHADPIAPIIFTFRGTDSLWAACRALSLYEDVDTQLALYENTLTTYIDYVNNYLETINTQSNWRLCGHSLGGRFAMDVLYEVLKKQHLNIPQRCDGCFTFNPFVTKDRRYRAMYSSMSLKRVYDGAGDDDGSIEHLKIGMRTHLKHHIIESDFASVVLLNPLTACGIITKYAANPDTTPITDDSWKSLVWKTFMNESSHSIANFAHTNPEEIFEGFDYEPGSALTFTTVNSETLEVYTHNLTDKYKLSMKWNFITGANPAWRFVSSPEMQSVPMSDYAFVPKQHEMRHMSVIKIGGKLYMNIPIRLEQLEDEVQDTQDDSFDEDVIVRIIPTEVANEYLIEEIFVDPQTSTITPDYAARCRLWSQPNIVWGGQRLPLEITSYGPVMGSNTLSKGYDTATAGADLNLRWTVGVWSDPGGDRRNLPYDPLWQLKSNDDITWVIKGSERSLIKDRYLEVITNGNYNVGNMALVFRDSVAASASPSGIQWIIQWDPQKLCFTIINHSQPSLIFGNGNLNTRTTTYSNSYNQHDGERTYTDQYNTVDSELELEAVPGEQDTFYIKRDWSTSPSGIERPQYIAVVGDYGGSNATNEPGFSDAHGTQDLVQWVNLHGDQYQQMPSFYYPAFDEFVIRPYDPAVDPMITSSSTTI